MMVYENSIREQKIGFDHGHCGQAINLHFNNFLLGFKQQSFNAREK